MKGRFHVYRFAHRRYEKRQRSEVLPGLNLEELAALVVSTDDSHQTEAVRVYRRRLLRRR